ncbi:hypothetical protein RDV89_10020 [Nocardioides zeae]|uniref:Uncharacterized protein n=1 Tax=Nocardioides imazamoxiresistens TaxID=3231893 RepID=A0ABU3PW24_9ACTN|nr:hypothetical protein [Nocardioides zeae]MDT9593404.1 hypothetical protein [Nocardioides zeae]
MSGRTPRVLAAVGLLALGVWGVGPQPLWEVLPAGTPVPTTVVVSGPAPDALRGAVVELLDGEAPLPSVLPLLTERLEPRSADVRRFQVAGETCHVEGDPVLTVLRGSVLALTFGDEVRTSAPPRCAAPDVRAFVLDVPASALERDYGPPPRRERADVPGALDAELLVDAPLADELYAPTIHVTAPMAPGEAPYAVVGPVLLPEPDADERRFQVVADVCGRTGPPVFVRGPDVSGPDVGDPDLGPDGVVAVVPNDGRECAVPERAVLVVDVRD